MSRASSHWPYAMCLESLNAFANSLFAKQCIAPTCLKSFARDSVIRLRRQQTPKLSTQPQSLGTSIRRALQLVSNPMPASAHSLCVPTIQQYQTRIHAENAPSRAALPFGLISRGLTLCRWNRFDVVQFSSVGAMSHRTDEPYLWDRALTSDPTSRSHLPPQKTKRLRVTTPNCVKAIDGASRFALKSADIQYVCLASDPDHSSHEPLENAKEPDSSARTTIPGVIDLWAVLYGSG